MNAPDIQKKIAEFCDKNGIYYNKTMQMSRRGFPDVIIVKNSIPIFIEIKTEKDRLSPLQKLTMNLLNKEKEISFVVKNFNDFTDLLKRLNFI